jgi:Tfp pilus assembly protein PilN
MIRINLVGGQKKKARASEGGEKNVMVGFGAIGLAAVALFLLVHRPLASEISDMEAENTKVEATRKQLEEETKELKVLQAEKAADEGRWQSITKLDSARAVPAWLLWELSNILTRGKQPQLTEAMKEELKTNLNRPWQDGWDTKHVWLISFKEVGSVFTLEGGAQSDSDATQLALRLQASMFFDEVSPKGGQEEIDKDTGLTYYRFTITGNVRY